MTVDLERVRYGLRQLHLCLGDPEVDLFFPGPAVPRPEGKPYRLRKGQTVTRQVNDRAAAWQRLLDWRAKIQFVVMQNRARVMTGPVFGTVEFRRLGDPALAVTGKPDAKNLLWALEDALNQHTAKIPGAKRRVVTWPGLWPDDSAVSLLPIRVHTDDAASVGARLRLWRIQG